MFNDMFGDVDNLQKALQQSNTEIALLKVQVAHLNILIGQLVVQLTIQNSKQSGQQPN